MARSTLDTARFTTTLGAGSVLALVAFVSMRSGLFTRDAGAEFVRTGFSPMALVDGVIDVPGELPSLEAALRQVPDGGTIRLAPGVHLGAVEVVGRSVRIVGAGAELCQIRGFGRAPVLSSTLCLAWRMTASARGETLSAGGLMDWVRGNHWGEALRARDA